uniref:A-kinase anchoring protein 10 n=1 Tax=Cynoglossus semilaevis TaxID=244447 RepID=A0A3P8WA27_CYNSE
SDTKVISQSSPLGVRNHLAIQEASGPSHVAINAISANMDSFARGRTAILKKQPSHMEAAHFGDLESATWSVETQRRAYMLTLNSLNSYYASSSVSTQFLAEHSKCVVEL